MIRRLKKIYELLSLRYDEYVLNVIEIGASATLGIVIGGILLYVYGFDPLKTYSILFLRGGRNINYLLSKATPIMLTGLAFAIPLIAGLFNIGGESQLYIGALSALVATYYIQNTVIGLLLSITAGAGLGYIIAILRIYRGVNEVISTIMVNWIIYFILLYIITSIIYNPNVPHETQPIPINARLGSIPTPIGDIRTIFFIAVLVSIITYYIIGYTDLGYLIKVSGYSHKTARYAGLNPDKALIYSMIIGGGLAGLGGGLLLIGYVYTIDTTLSTLYGLGFSGIGVSLLGRNNPIGIIISSIFFSMLIIGGEMIELYVGAPPELADVLSGIIIISLSLPYAYRLLINYFKIRGMEVD